MNSCIFAESEQSQNVKSEKISSVIVETPNISTISNNFTSIKLRIQGLQPTLLLPPIKNNFAVHPNITNQQVNSCFLKFYSKNIFFNDKSNVQKPAMYRE